MSDSRRRSIAALQAASSASPRHSPLFRWLTEHHDEIVGDGSPILNWEPWRAEAAADGIVDGLGREPTKPVMKRTWYAVRATKAKALARRARVAAAGAATVATGTRVSSPPAAVVGQRPSDQMPLAPNPMPAAAQPSPEQVPTGTEDGPDAAIKRVLDQMDARYRRKHGFYGG